MEDDTRPLYEQLEGEPANWYARFLLYRNQKTVGRSLIDAYRLYQLQAGKRPVKPVSDAPGAWKEAFSKYDWKVRAIVYDDYLEAERKKREAILFQLEQDEIERILTTGYAAMHERIKGLDRMAKVLEDSFIDPDTREVNYKFLNPDKVREYRGCLDDIAKELGARIKKAEIAGKNGGPMEVEITTNWGGGAIEEEASE